MKFRTYKNTDLTVSEVGFGLWTISTGWWGNFTEDQAIALMHKAFDLGINLFDAADTYGNGLSNCKLKILNAQGQLIAQGSTTFNQIDVSYLQPGIYFLSLTDTDGKTSTSKFIKN